MKFTYKLSEEDYGKWAEYNVAKTEREVLKVLRKCVFLLLLMMTLATLIGSSIPSKLFFKICCLALFSLLLIVMIFCYRKHFNKRIDAIINKPIKKSFENNPAKDENELEMNEKGIACSNDVSKVFVKWICVTKICFNSKYVFLMTNNITFIIPIYKTEHSIQKVLDYVKTFLSKEDLYVEMGEKL